MRLTGFSEGLCLVGTLCWAWSLTLVGEEGILLGICVLLASSGLRSSTLIAVEWDEGEIIVTDGRIGTQVPERDCFSIALQTHRPKRLAIRKSQ